MRKEELHKWFKGWDSSYVVYGSLVNRKAKKHTKGFEILCVKLECAKFCACVQVLSFLRVWECLRIFQHNKNLAL